MIIKNMRWNYNGRGYGYGADEGVYLVETVVTDAQQQTFFILCMRDLNGYRLFISETPMIDIVAYASPGEAFERELKKLSRIAFKEYGFTRANDNAWYPDDDDVVPMDKLFHCPGLFEEPFNSPIRLTLAAMERCFEQREPDDDQAYYFVMDWLNMDISLYELDY